MSVDKLIKKAQKGEKSAFNELLRAHYDTIYSIAWRWCGDQTNAQDITQNVCLKLATQIHSFAHQSSFATWLYRLTINSAKDFYKSPKQHNMREQELEDEYLPANTNTEDQLHAQQMLARISELNSDLSDALVLVFIEGLNHAQTAKRLGIKESTVSWRIHQARKELKAMFESPSITQHQTPLGGQA